MHIKKNLKFNELSKMSSTFFVSLKLMEILNIWTALLSFNKLDKFPNISVNFKGKNVADYILEISRLVVFGVKLLSAIQQNYVYEIILLEQRRHRSPRLIPMFIGTPCIILIIWNSSF